MHAKRFHVFVQVKKKQKLTPEEKKIYAEREFLYDVIAEVRDCDMARMSDEHCRAEHLFRRRNERARRSRHPRPPSYTFRALPFPRDRVCTLVRHASDFEVATPLQIPADYPATLYAPIMHRFPLQSTLTDGVASTKPTHKRIVVLRDFEAALPNALLSRSHPRFPIRTWKHKLTQHAVAAALIAQHSQRLRSSCQSASPGLHCFVPPRILSLHLIHICNVHLRPCELDAKISPAILVKRMAIPARHFPRDVFAPYLPQYERPELKSVQQGLDATFYEYNELVIQACVHCLKRFFSPGTQALSCRSPQ
eukprot:1267051-Pleurochrysis_carterae.AAC.1